MNVDGVVLTAAAGGFVVYVLSHVIFFRFIKESQIIKSLVFIFLAATAVNIGLFCYFVFHSKVSVLEAFLAWLISFTLYSMVCFLYVVGVIGPYESSIRIRLIRELYQTPSRGFTLEEILRRYNSQMILKNRLERFLGSGEIILKEDVYLVGEDRYIFTALECAVGFLRKITSRNS